MIATSTIVSELLVAGSVPTIVKGYVTPWYVNDDVQCGTVFDVAGTIVTDDSVLNIGSPTPSVFEFDCAAAFLETSRIRVSTQRHTSRVFRKARLLSWF